MVIDRGEGTLRGGDVESDLGGVHLEGEFDPVFLEDIHDRAETVREILEAAVDLTGKHRWERIDEVPDRRAGETIDHAHAELLGRDGGLLQFLGSALADAFGITVTPDVVGENLLVPGIDVVTDGLADEVARNREAFHAVFLEEGAFGGTIGGIGLLHFEVVALTTELDTVVAHRLGFGDDRFAIEIGPLAGEKSDGSAHDVIGFGGFQKPDSGANA